MKRMAISLLAPAIGSILLLGACSTVQESKPRPPKLDQMLAQVSEQDGRACIRVNDITGYGMLSDDMLSVQGRRKQHYLVTTLIRCHSLQSSFNIQFSSRYGDICGGGISSIKTRDEECSIRHIYEFPSRDEAFATLEVAKARIEAIKQFPKPAEE